MQGVEDRLRGLLVSGLAGDAAAYHRFLQELSGFLRGFLRRRMTALPDDVEDLVQEVLLAVHNQRHTYDRAQPLTPWLHALARYKLVDLLRRRSRTEALHDPLDEESEVLAAPADDGSEARRDVAKLLAQLPDRHRVPLQYVKLEGLSVREAAQRSGMSESAVKVGIHRGLKALAAMLGRNA